MVEDCDDNPIIGRSVGSRTKLRTVANKLEKIRILACFFLADCRVCVPLAMPVPSEEAPVDRRPIDRKIEALPLPSITSVFGD